MSSEDCNFLSNTALLEGFYTRVYPTSEELVSEIGVTISEEKLQDIVVELRNEVNLLKVETELLEHQGVPQPQSSPHTRLLDSTSSLNNESNLLSSSVNDESGRLLMTFNGSGILSSSAKRGAGDATTANNTLKMSLGGGSLQTGELSGTSTSRRGRSYRRKMDESVGKYVTVADKMAMLTKEEERLLAIEKNDEAAADQIRGLLIATAEEADRRAKELRLERKLLIRDVLSCDNSKLLEDTTINNLDGVDASAEELLRYMERCKASHESYLDKLKMQCSAAEQDITRAGRQLRQHQIAGEAFRPVDFEQLGIENEQFNERAEQKSAELVVLKGASTRTVQALNATTDALNDLVAEQNQLKKEYKSRCEYLARCTKEMSSVAKEVVVAEKKNEAIRAKHESVKAPSIEEYIAQRAELFELEKAEKNWTRKVEIAQGQMRALRQKVLKLAAQRDAALAYAVERQNQRVNNLKAGARSLKSGSLNYNPLQRLMKQRVQPATSASTGAAGTALAGGGLSAPPHGAPLVANSRSLINAKRQTKGR